MEKNSTSDISDFSTNHPSSWDLEAFRANWHVFFESIVSENCSSLVPRKRIRFQIEQTPAFRDIAAGWEKMNGSQRLDAWKQLLAAADTSSREILPACVQCGECCRTGSPTLQLEDMELLRIGKVPLDQLMTLRRGEPALSPFDDKPFVLTEERIKIREKEGARECALLDSETDQCRIYSDRPLQCRAQACWDPLPARDLAEQPFLLRKHIFEGIDVLLEIISEHDSRCSFEALTRAFETLAEKGQEAVGEVLRLLSYEEHFRDFVVEQFKIPPENMELLFGRSFSKMVPLFGHRVVVEPDGTRCLCPEE